MLVTESNSKIELPFGLIHFKLLMAEPGAEAVVTFYLSKRVPDVGQWYKYDTIEEVWLDYTAYTQLNPDRKSVQLTVKDCGFGDADGIENGIIVDPIGFADMSGGGSDTLGSIVDATPIEEIANAIGCFISTAAQQPADGRPFHLWKEVRGREPALIFLLALLAIIIKTGGARVARRRRLRL